MYPDPYCTHRLARVIHEERLQAAARGWMPARVERVRRPRRASWIGVPWRLVRQLALLLQKA